MKTKKMCLLFAAFIFAAVAGYNIHLAQTQNLGDISLADIAIMAQATGEINPDCPNGCTTEPGHCWCYRYYPWEEYDGWDN